MSSERKVLVTGATGHLGTAVCRALVAAGHHVRATDRKFGDAPPVKPRLGDLLDEHFVYGAIDGCDAVVHLGNHPNQFVGPSPQQILAENVRMNANVFWAAAQLGVRDIVFASSVQVMLRSDSRRSEPPYPLPYLPLDGKCPRDPGTNSYAMSKEVGERMLEELCREHSELCATALRFPMLPRSQWADHLRQTRLTSIARLNMGECMTHLLIEDAAAVVVQTLTHRRTGYRQYFPAWSMQLRGLAPATIAQRYYPGVQVRCAPDLLVELIDLSDLRRELNWEPTERIVIDFE